MGVPELSRRRNRVVFIALAMVSVGCSDSPSPHELIRSAPETAVVTTRSSVSKDNETASNEGAETLESDEIVDSRPEPVFRPDDDRRFVDPQVLQNADIDVYESKRLRLYTDVDANIARNIPPLIDLVYERLVEDFGPLPPARDEKEFQISGYLIAERDRFLASGLLPEEFAGFQHGQHFGQEFWMYDQELDYYRRHLAIHEATHCFMMRVPGIHPPLWYLEGIADFYGTHRFNERGHVEFGVMPDSPEEFLGFGRIDMIREEVEAGKRLSVVEVSELGEVEFSKSRSTPYAWSWALCKFLDSHPRYQKRFRLLRDHLVGPDFVRIADQQFAPDLWLLEAEWEEFCRTIDFGWEFETNAFVMSDEAPVDLPERATFSIAANQGWTWTGYRLQAGETVHVTAEGQAVLNTTPVDWVSEPQGITIEYANGFPVGRLMAAVLIDPAYVDETNRQRMEVIDIGSSRTIKSEFGGLLMFQVNDFGNNRSNNVGEYNLILEAVEDSSVTP
ncbi:hypothetical protein KOR42_38840 [Thalassoglobus neptunius]|uniref:DUF1570 domain-containing protein n=1 Tax=Thalassoglobus neptunius TaxID=1938619 RepID=A0A5C5WIH7_9PLAN|nr:hypothetical protein [Thalassoglobus neptunius]TWT49811.1 hypothetical protein KOR42_38840 [Thalassoglobus neptunius]